MTNNHNPMIPNRKETPVMAKKANTEQSKKQPKAESTKDYAELFRKAWNFKVPITMENLIVPAERTVSSAITYCSIAASCGAIKEKDLPRIQKDLLCDLEEATKYQHAHMVVFTIAKAIQEKNTREGNEILLELSELLGVEFYAHNNSNR